MAIIDYIEEDKALQDYFQNTRKLSHGEAIQVLAVFVANSIHGAKNPARARNLFLTMVDGAHDLIKQHKCPECAREGS